MSAIVAPRSLLLAVAMVLAAWLSQMPYFVWEHRAIVLFVSGLVLGIAAVLTFWPRRYERPAQRDLMTGALLVAFLLYITAERTVAGGHTMWVFALPTVIAIFIADQAERRLAYRIFETIFAISLVPGLILLLLMIAGVPLTFSVRPPVNPTFAAAGIRVLQGPGAVFIESNSQVLPWGGVISRLCGIYDEPGMVGTIAALMLAVRGFDVRGWRAWLLWLGGLCSLSLAFVVLTAAGLAVRALTARERKPAVLVAPVIVAGLFTIGALSPPATATPPSRVQVEVSPHVSAPAHMAGEVRQRVYLNNRSLPEMDQLVDRYWHSDWKTRLFGIASDASVVYGGVSAVWTRILTNHGLVGLIVLGAAFLGYAVTSWRRAAALTTMLIFFGCFWLSFYQRPVIWMPYNLLVYFGGLAMLERSPGSREVESASAAASIR